MAQGITLRQATSGEILEGSALLPFLRWNAATSLWEPGAGGATVLSAQQALETFGSETVADGGTTTSADGPVHLATDVCGQTPFPAGASLDLEWLSHVSSNAAGDVYALMTLEASTDGGAVWAPLTPDARATFTAAGLNNPVTVAVMRTTLDLSGLPSFALRAVFDNSDVSATSPAVFGEPRVKWSYVSPA
jgi:hypothetical protein